MKSGSSQRKRQARRLRHRPLPLGVSLPHSSNPRRGSLRILWHSRPTTDCRWRGRISISNCPGMVDIRFQRPWRSDGGRLSRVPSRDFFKPGVRSCTYRRLRTISDFAQQCFGASVDVTGAANGWGSFGMTTLRLFTFRIVEGPFTLQEAKETAAPALAAGWKCVYESWRLKPQGRLD